MISVMSDTCVALQWRIAPILESPKTLYPFFFFTVAHENGSLKSKEKCKRYSGFYPEKSSPVCFDLFADQFWPFQYGGYIYLRSKGPTQRLCLYVRVEWVELWALMDVTPAGQWLVGGVHLPEGAESHHGQQQLLRHGELHGFQSTGIYTEHHLDKTIMLYLVTL